MNYYREENFTPSYMHSDGYLMPATLSVREPGASSEDVYHGNEALANSRDSQQALDWQADNPYEAIELRKHDNAVTDSLGYKLGKIIRNIGTASKDNVVGFLENGPIVGSMGGGLVGAGVGALGGLVSKHLMGNDADLINWTGIGAGTGAALTSLLGRTMRNKKLDRDKRRGPRYQTEEDFYKSAAMYTNPINAILEKLQAATDVTAMEKAKLAAAVKQMNASDASRLASLVRSTLGFGVGAVIAKFFGASRGGMVVGGLIGQAFANTLPNMLAKPKVSIGLGYEHAKKTYF